MTQPIRQIKRVTVLRAEQNRDYVDNFVESAMQENMTYEITGLFTRQLSGPNVIELRSLITVIKHRFNVWATPIFLDNAYGYEIRTPHAII